MSWIVFVPAISAQEKPVLIALSPGSTTPAASLVDNFPKVGCPNVSLTLDASKADYIFKIDAKILSIDYVGRMPLTWGQPIQNFTSIDRPMRFSIFFRSGVQPGTRAPGDPQIFSTTGAVGQVVGVTPPGPEKYGTFAAR